MTNRRSIYINIAFFALLIVGYLIVNYQTSTPSDGPLVSFESAGLNLPLTPLQPGGKSLSIKDYRGGPILLHFWASWCEPCTHDEKPLQEIYQAANGHGVQFVSVASEDKFEAVRRMGKLETYPGDRYLDQSGQLALAFSVKTYPHTLLIDREGRVLFRADGPLAAEDVQRLKQEFSSAANVVSPFEFPEAHGGKLTEKNLVDKVWVASFIFTSCPHTCPMISEKLRELQSEFGNDPRFHIVSFSVDPKTDTPARLLEFGQKHGAKAETWSLLRPEEAPLRKLMAQGFRLGTMDDPLSHTAKIVVVDKGNSIADYFDGDSLDAVPKMKAKLATLLR